MKTETADHSEAPTASEPDLLRSEVLNLTPQQEDALSKALLVKIHKSIAELSTLELQDVARFIDLVEHDHGCSTPVEAFITGLVTYHYAIRPLTPETVAEQLDPKYSDGFRRNFDDAIEATRRMCRTYPNLT